VRIDLETKYVRGLVFDQRKKMFKYLSTDNGREEVDKVIAELAKLQQGEDVADDDGNDDDDGENEDDDDVDKDDALPSAKSEGVASGKALGDQLREQVKARRRESRRDMERRAVREVFKRYDEHGLGFIDR
jgi:hypothetical protein